jgi:hypothetical protein
MRAMAAARRKRLAEKVADAAATAIPDGTPRLVRGTLTFKGKATAVIGTRRAGKTMFLHQLRRERAAAGTAIAKLLYINFEDEQLAGMTAADLGFVIEEHDVPGRVIAEPAYEWLLAGQAEQSRAEGQPAT